MPSPILHNPHFPVQLVKDKFTLIESIRKFATHLVSEAATQKCVEDEVLISFDRDQLFHLSAMLFQLVSLVDEIGSD